MADQVLDANGNPVLYNAAGQAVAVDPLAQSQTEDGKAAKFGVSIMRWLFGNNPLPNNNGAMPNDQGNAVDVPASNTVNVNAETSGGGGFLLNSIRGVQGGSSALPAAEDSQRPGWFSGFFGSPTGSGSTTAGPSWVQQIFHGPHTSLLILLGVAVVGLVLLRRGGD